MPIDTALTEKIWNRYVYLRDTGGHKNFVLKADQCEMFFAGQQWAPQDVAALKAAKRPALTINKILSTIANVMGEQIYNRSEIAFRPRSGAPAETAEVLTKVFKQISDNNQLDWKRSDLFADGCITSRGFLDVRIDFTDSMQGEVRVEKLNPKNVMVDADADDYDPDTWADVFITKWLTADDIAVLYSKDDAELLRNKDNAGPYVLDAMDWSRDRFGGNPRNPNYTGTYDDSNVLRNVRVIERQYRQLDRQKWFLAPQTGDMRPIPDSWDRNKIAWFVDNIGLQVVPKLVRRIRWCVIAGNVVLHDDWSPYKHFTVVPYFPYFRHGRTIGLVENLLGPQELLNKVSSQELHVINTTANSGYIVKAGSLVNMSVEELTLRGAETGVVIEVSDDVANAIEKITPNAMPTGLDRVSYKAEEHIKSISGVPDSVQGFDREDVAAKAIQAKRQAAQTNIVKPLDSLTRTDFILARNVLDLVQEFYTEERILTITHDKLTGDHETFRVNQADPATGEVLNDLTLGEYDVVVSSVPQRETLEDSQFDQAVALKELGVPIPDTVLIENSRLMRKSEILKQMQGDQNSPEAQEQAELQRRAQEAEVSKLEGEAAGKHADAQLRQAKTETERVKAHKEAITPPEDNGAAAKEREVEADIALEDRKFQHQVQLDYQELHHKMQLEREQAQQDAALKAEQAATERQIRVQQAAQAASNPQGQQPANPKEK
jgi:uncharacterized protein YkvS